MRTRFLFTSLLACTVAAPAQGQVWTDWVSADPGGVSGTMMFGSTVDVFYEGGYEASRTYVSDPATPWSWDYAPYEVDGVRPSTTDQVGFSAATSGKFVFSSPVLNPFIAIMSLGRSGLPVRYDFSDPFTVISEGRGYWGDGTYETSGCGPGANGACATPGTWIDGREFHGVIQFEGTFTELAIETAPTEFWHSVTVGAEGSVAVPEPGTFALLASGLLGLGFAGRRRREGQAA